MGRASLCFGVSGRPVGHRLKYPSFSQNEMEEKQES